MGRFVQELCILAMTRVPVAWQQNMVEKPIIARLRYDGTVKIDHHDEGSDFSSDNCVSICLNSAVAKVSSGLLGSWWTFFNTASA